MLARRGDLTPTPRLDAPRQPAVLALLVLGVAALAAFPFTGAHDESLMNATFWALVPTAAAAIVVGGAVLVRGAARLGTVLDAAA